jgi:hypothetical protein
MQEAGGSIASMCLLGPAPRLRSELAAEVKWQCGLRLCVCVCQCARLRMQRGVRLAGVAQNQGASHMQINAAVVVAFVLTHRHR